MKTKIYWIGLLAFALMMGCKQPTPTSTKIPLDKATWIGKECLHQTDGDVLCPYSFIRMYPDSSFVAGALRGYVQGSWQQDTARKLILLTPDTVSASAEKAPTLFGIAYHSTHYLHLVMVRNEDDFKTGNGVILKMRAADTTGKADPFAAVHQSWRQKPDAPETPAQIKARVKAYLEFLEAFYAFASLNQLQKPDNGWFPNVMNMESSGSVRLAYNNELEDWYACFYDEEQAIEGYKMISGAFLNLTLAKTEDRNERNRDAIVQILNTLEK